jgi:hypothetical protein
MGTAGSTRACTSIGVESIDVRGGAVRFVGTVDVAHKIRDLLLCSARGALNFICSD